jgi:hypothetical protein
LLIKKPLASDLTPSELPLPPLRRSADWSLRRRSNSNVLSGNSATTITVDPHIPPVTFTLNVGTDNRASGALVDSTDTGLVYLEARHRFSVEKPENRNEKNTKNIKK